MKKIITLFLSISILFAGIINCNAETKTYDRSQLDNYGVNKDWNITSNNLPNVMKTPAVDASVKIYDFSDVLSDDEETVLQEKINSFIKSTNMDLVIVIDNFSYYKDSQNEEYAADFYDYNDFGMEYENNSGVLLLRNTYESDPYYDMYTFGNAQLYFDQTRYDNILDGIYNDLHSGNYVSGFSSFIDRTQNYILSGQPSGLKKYKVNEKGYLYQEYYIPWFFVIGISSLITIVVILTLVKKNKMVSKAHSAVEYINRSSINISNRQDRFVSTHTTHYTTSSSSGSGSGGGFSSHSGSSGGGHSSGGGRHG